MNTHYLVAVSGTPLPALTYGSDLMLAAGTRVLVPLGQRQLVGVVLATIEAPTDAEYAVKSIISALDDAPLWQESELKLLAWCARYYHAQQHASDKIAESFGDFKAWLLMGVTGSGKTEVYAQLINQVLQQQKQVLMLVPEIGLTAPMVSRLAQRLNTEPVLLHSERTNSQRAQVWQLTRQGHPLLLIGTRSAIFAPLPKLGLIIVDEEHDSAYKQQDSIRYHARDVALMRAKQQVCPIVLGSATPSLESLANVDQGKLHLLTLTQRANQQTLPTMLTIDMRQQKLDGALSPQLLSAVERTLAEQGQVLLFLNRRGYSPVLMCHDCGHTLDCPACEVPYTFHRHAPNLRCHHCGKVAQIRAGDPCIILGTQMLAKGHDFAGIALVGIIDVDSALFARDFRSLERLAQLVIQVSGRAGRGSQAGQVLLQTHQPHHDFVQSLLTKPYAEIAQQLLKERSDTQLPPFSFSAWLLAEGKHLDRVQAQLEKLLPLCQHTKVQVAGPMPALMHKRQYHYRELLWLQSEQRADLHATIDNLLAFLQQPEGKVTGVRVFLDVDPQDMP
ncbi:MAG: primosomal protein N' [Thiotrichales bacterium 17-46-47]|nr:MAG: primosomal protein N' [Thiotrichales bacterium 17-46-47]